jgi:hypothetical protein
MAATLDWPGREKDQRYLDDRSGDISGGRNGTWPKITVWNTSSPLMLFVFGQGLIKANAAVS